MFIYIPALCLGAYNQLLRTCIHTADPALTNKWKILVQESLIITITSGRDGMGRLIAAYVVL
jgi:hypothetical protein